MIRMVWARLVLVDIDWSEFRFLRSCQQVAIIDVIIFKLAGRSNGTANPAIRYVS
jgi:hypothetical protein